MAEQQIFLLDINNFINEDDEKYDNFNFVTWDGMDLVLKNTSMKEEHIIKQEIYMEWLKQV